jgi:hypothetical protein
VIYIAPSHSDIARQNAETNQHLLPLKLDSKQKCLEFFFDSPEIPNYVIFENELIVLSRRKDRTSPFQMFGDDGPLYIQSDQKILLNRIENWIIPSLSLRVIYRECDALVDAIEKIKAIIS